MKHPTRVLVVDDEDRFRTNMLTILRKSGLEAEEAADGSAALKLLETEDFDVVLLDLMMPGLSGERVLQILKERSTPAEVVVLTGHADMDKAIELIGLGAFDVLLKPASAEDIVLKVRLACENKLLNEGAISFKDILQGPS